MLQKLLPPWVVPVAIGVLLLAIAGLGLLLRDAWRENGAQGELLDRARKANDGLLDVIGDMRNFQQEVRDGFKQLQGTLGGLQQQNTAYRRKVDSNADSGVPLTPVERDALGVLFPANPVRGGPAPPVRGTGAP